MPITIDRLLANLEAGAAPGVVLVVGDLTLAEAGGERIAGRIASAAGCTVETHRHPPSLEPILADLRTFSLFAGGKVVLAIDTALLADRSLAAALIDDVRDVLPFSGGERSLTGKERQAAARLLQALRLFDIDPYAGSAADRISGLPDWALEGATGRRKAKKGGDELQAGLAALLEAARREDLQGWAEGSAAALAEVVRAGLPPGHALVLAERAVAAGHPIVDLLEERKAVVRLAEIESERGGWQGLDTLGAELARQTGVEIASDAMAELARRTLRQGGRKEGGTAEAESSSRLAGEYRKLANLAGAGGRIERRMVEDNVEDRGEEDVWQILDAIGGGRAGEALDRLSRLLGSAEEPVAARLSFFGLLAAYCRQLTACSGLIRVAGVPAGETNYPRFKDKLAPALQRELPGGGKNPLAGLHPYRLHKAYLAASRLPLALASRLPAEVLDTEMQIKGESRDPDVALARLVALLAGSSSRRAPASAASGYAGRKP
ncbi:MAG TPA: hypothetical protein VGS22_07375 [Thermoanaerobaculia bacterium]|jgi:DNA polymerase III delta subunit|nr:hypothetical protein [Thermoanaerobaculia bacterium]